MPLISQAAKALGSSQISRPALLSEWHIERPGGGAVVFRAERTIRYLTGAVMEHLIPLIDGTRTRDEIVQQLGIRFSGEQIDAALVQLQPYLREGASQAPAEDAFWSLLDADPASVAVRRRTAVVDVLAPPDHDTAMTRQALEAHGISISSGAAFRMVVIADYLSEQLRRINAEALAANTPWMLVRPFGRRQWIGPLFIPGRTACWACLAHILERNGWVSGGSLARFPTNAAITQTLAAGEAAKWLLTGSNAAIEGAICEVDTGVLGIRTHHVRPRPQCPACGGRTPIRPEALISPLTGIVASIDIEHSEPAFTVAVAELSQVLRPDASGDLLYSNRGLAAGKGRHPDEARRRCMGEAIERYSTQFHGDEPSITASLNELGTRAIDPRTLLLFSDRQYNTGPPPRFDPAAPTQWTPVRSLVSGEQRFVPTAYAYYGYGHPACGADSNGCAAGETLNDAIVRGLLELIERDAVSLWWYNRALRPAMPLGPQPGDLFHSLRARLTALHVLDVTTDFAVPTAVAVGVAGDHVLFGAGSGNEAAARALEELAAHVVEPKPSAACALAEWMLPAGDPREHATPQLQLDDLVRRAKALGLDVFVLDLTRPETSVPVARVIVPGLRPWRRRLAPGRLYETPVALGWLPAQLTEAEMNPTAFPL